MATCWLLIGKYQMDDAMVGVILILTGLALAGSWVFNRGDATLRDYPTPEELDDDRDGP